MSCKWCNTPRSYYPSVDNAYRQNCRSSDSGYHEFVRWRRLMDCLRTLWGSDVQRSQTTQNSLLQHRQKRAHTI